MNFVSRVVRWWFTDPSTGEIVLWQAPNAPLLVAETTATLLALGVLPRRSRLLASVKSVALVVWSIDEVARGTTPFRRLLGAVTFGWQARRTLSLLRTRT